MGAKLGLLKTISIDPLVILPSCMNFIHAYSTLFLNEKLLLFKKTGISAKYAMNSLSSTGSLACPLLLFVNSIALNLLWVD